MQEQCSESSYEICAGTEDFKIKDRTTECSRAHSLSFSAWLQEQDKYKFHHSSHANAPCFFIAIHDQTRTHIAHTTNSAREPKQINSLPGKVKCSKKKAQQQKQTIQSSNTTFKTNQMRLLQFRQDDSNQHSCQHCQALYCHLVCATVGCSSRRRSSSSECHQ